MNTQLNGDGGERARKSRRSNIYVRCPECKHVFEDSDTFWWGADWNGDPTVEHIYCPKCFASTQPIDRRRKEYAYESFTVVENQQPKGQ